MKQLGITLLFSLIFSFSFAQDRGDLTIHFNIEEPSGTLMIQLRDSTGEKIENRMVPVRSTSAQTTFQRLNVGEKYIVAVFQDLNGNEKMDHHFYGPPKEPYGFSNDARGTMGPPDLEDQWIVISGNMRIDIKVE